MRAEGDPLPVARYRRMRFIRRFEQVLLDLFEAGALTGTTHCCIGQEANAVGVIEHLGDEDHVFGHHRSHGHFLAKTEDALGLLAEVMGKSAGACEGRGGSQHLAGPGFVSNGVQGGIVPAAAGIGWAMKLDGRPGVSVAFVGDGTFGEGVVYETLNLAALWQLPLWVVVEDNGWAQSTPRAANLAGSIEGRFEAFGIPSRTLDTTDVEAISAASQDELHKLRTEGGPRALIISTYRLCHHSNNDDHRPEAEVEARWAIEPLAVHGARLTPSARACVDAEVEAELVELVAAARALP